MCYYSLDTLVVNRRGRNILMCTNTYLTDINKEYLENYL